MVKPVKEKSLSERFVGIRHFSWMNPFIDVCVFVPIRFLEKAKETLRKGMNAYWDFQFECYGDCVEEAFKNAKIPHISRYIDWEDDDEVVGPKGEDFEKCLAMFGCPIEYVTLY